MFFSSWSPSDPAGQQCRQKLPSTGYFRHIGFLLSYTFVGLNSALVFSLMNAFYVPCIRHTSLYFVYRLPTLQIKYCYL